MNAPRTLHTMVLCNPKEDPSDGDLGRVVVYEVREYNTPGRTVKITLRYFQWGEPEEVREYYPLPGEYNLTFMGRVNDIGRHLAATGEWTD